MARFYTSGTNSRNKTFTAMGRSSGQEVHIRGWNAGIRIIARPSSKNEAPEDVDVFEVWQTGGSNGGFSHMIGELINGVFKPCTH